MKNSGMKRAVAIVISGGAVYFFALAAIGFLDEAYLGIVKQPPENSENFARHQSIVSQLKSFSENDLVKQGLSWILTTFAALAVGAITKNDDDEVLDHKVESEPGGIKGQMTKERYVKVLSTKIKRLQGNFSAIQHEHKKRAGELYAVRKFARRKFLVSTTFLVAFCFAFAHVAAAGIEAVVNAYQLYDNKPEPLRFFLLFSQSTALLVCSGLIPYWFYLSYLKKVKKPDLKSMFMIGWTGVFVAGFMGFVQQSPEVYSLQLGNPDVMHIPYFDVHFLTFLMVTKLLVFPMIGMIACGVAGKLPLRTG